MEGSDQLIGAGINLNRLSLVGILNQGLRIEYRFVVTYPRLIDRLVYIEGRANREMDVVKALERLGTDSVKHADWEAELIRELGGEPEFDFEFAERPVSIDDWCMRQLERERFALFLYQNARDMVARSLAGDFWAKLEARLSSLMSGRRSEEAKRHTIDCLDKLVGAEKGHVGLLIKALEELGIMQGE